MALQSIDDEQVLEKIQEWFTGSEDLFVNLYYLHSGSSGFNYFVSSYSDFTQMVGEASSGAIFTILREKQYPLCGLVDDSFIHQAQQVIRDGQWYGIVERVFYPSPIIMYGGDDTHDALLQELEGCRGQRVCVGEEPSLPDYPWHSIDEAHLLIAAKQ